MNYTDNNGTLSMCQSSETFQLNASDSEYERIVNGTPGYTLWGILFVILATFGNIGNIITIIVLKREPIMSTLTILLIGLAISDILAPQANALLAFSHYHLAPHYSNSIVFLKFNNFIRYVIQPLGTMFTMSSSWIITTTTLFRLIAVMWPFKARTLINKKCAMIALIVIFSMSLISIIPIYASLVIRTRCTSDRTRTYTGFDIDQNKTSVFFNTIYTPVLHIMCFYLPWLTSLTLWFFLIRSLRKAERNFNITFLPKDGSGSVSFGGGGSLLYQHMPSTCSALLENQSKKHSTVTYSSTAGTKSNSIFQYPTSRTQSKVFIRNGSYFHNGSICTSTRTPSLNIDSRINNVQYRVRSYNRITLMVAVLCFINLICQLFTFVFIFELIFNKIQIDLKAFDTKHVIKFAKARFPKFLSYSLLLNNIFLGINHSCSIFIYTSTNPRFKRNLLNLFKKILFTFLRVVYTKQQLYKFQLKHFQTTKQTNGAAAAGGVGGNGAVGTVQANNNQNHNAVANDDRTANRNVQLVYLNNGQNGAKPNTRGNSVVTATSTRVQTRKRPHYSITSQNSCGILFEDDYPTSPTTPKSTNPIYLLNHKASTNKKKNKNFYYNVRL